MPVSLLHLCQVTPRWPLLRHLEVCLRTEWWIPQLSTCKIVDILRAAPRLECLILAFSAFRDNHRPQRRYTLDLPEIDEQGSHALGEPVVAHHLEEMHLCVVDDTLFRSAE
jgi:hypothetical protein